MSKAEFFQQLESLTPAELDDVAIRVDELRHRNGDDQLSDTERRILEERMARAAVNPDRGEAWEVVRDRVSREIKARATNK